MKIGIISLGLIGGSLFKKLIKEGYNVVGVTRNAETIDAAKKYTEFVSNDIESVKDCSVIFVCSPMNKTLEILDKLETIVSCDAIVADVCSLKAFVMKKQRPYIFIGSHPMAGTENNGFSYSFEKLFDEAKWVLTPFDNTPEHSLNKIKKIIEDTGAKTLLADPQEHDKAVALISHMPMLVSQALMQTAMKNPLALKLASSGFRDMTRLALSNTQMAVDMFMLNNKNIFDSFDSLVKNTQTLSDENYSNQIEEIKAFRKNMYNENGKNISN